MPKGKGKSKKSEKPVSAGTASGTVVDGKPVQEVSSAVDANIPTVPPKPGELAFYARDVDEVLSVLQSVTSLKESELCKRFDVHISSETSMPEEGIQAARDLYLEVAREQEVLISKFNAISSQKSVLSNEFVGMKERILSLSEETSRGLHQRDVLHNLADELSRQKEVNVLFLSFYDTEILLVGNV